MPPHNFSLFTKILVATPGRLRDHIENTAGFSTRLMGVKVLVLDEADHLLDVGFRTDIEKIVTAVPNQRQALLFFCYCSGRGFIFFYSLFHCVVSFPFATNKKETKENRKVLFVM